MREDLKISIAHLYPKLLNLYGDLGNVITLKKRCEWRGIEVEFEEINIGDSINAHDLYFKAKMDALNSQYEFFKELLWVQRGLVSVNWAKANKEAKEWMLNVPKVLPEEEDFVLSL